MFVSDDEYKGVKMIDLKGKMVKVSLFGFRKKIVGSTRKWEKNLWKFVSDLIDV